MRTAVRPSGLLMFTSVGRDSGHGWADTHADHSLRWEFNGGRLFGTSDTHKRVEEEDGENDERRGGRKAPTRPAITTQPLNNHKKSK